MNICIIQVGKDKQSYITAACQDFLKRLRHHAKINIITLKESQSSDIKQIITGEATQIISKIPPNHHLICLDQTGRRFSSEKFATYLQQQMNSGYPNLCFIIGGPYGLSSKLLKQADLILSFSDFTFTHQLIRLLLLEQIYRAFSILKNTNYHH